MRSELSVAPLKSEGRSTANLRIGYVRDGRFSSPDDYRRSGYRAGCLSYRPDSRSAELLGERQVLTGARLVALEWETTYLSTYDIKKKIFNYSGV
jgi:hypothetical protein